MAYEYVKEFENRVPTQDYVSRAMCTEMPMLRQTEPLAAEALSREFQADYDKALAVYAGYRMEVSGAVIFKGLDIHGIPSFELSDRKDGICYVLCCLRSEREYGNINEGDTAVISGNYLTVHEKYGVVLKNCTLRMDSNGETLKS